MKARVAIYICLGLLAACDVTQPQQQEGKSANSEESINHRQAALAQFVASNATGTNTGASTQAPASLAGESLGSHVMAGPAPARMVPDRPFQATEFGRFNNPWAMAFLPDHRLLVTEELGGLRMLDLATGHISDIAGLPPSYVLAKLNDIVLHPQFAANSLLYFSFIEKGASGRTYIHIARARLVLDANGNGAIVEQIRIWNGISETNAGNYGNRLAFGPDGKLYISAGDRGDRMSVQQLHIPKGKILRFNDDGTIPLDNPWAESAVWTLGHLNQLGLAFDGQGRLWEHELGPVGGDELNLIERGANYGWPVVSDGDGINGEDIPDHSTRPDFYAPKISWNPAIQPAGFIFYSGNMFSGFRGNGFLGSLATQDLIRIEFNGVTAKEVARYPMGAVIREVEQGPDGAIWVLEKGENARLLRLTPTY